jgi:hypothetical protein
MKCLFHATGHTTPPGPPAICHDPRRQLTLHRCVPLSEIAITLLLYNSPVSPHVLHFMVHLNGDASIVLLQELATSWTVRGSNTGGGEIFSTRPDRPWGPPNLLYNAYQVIPWVNRPGRGVDHPHLAPRLKKEYSYTSTPPLGLHGLL